jgi:hypothetical protein
MSSLKVLSLAFVILFSIVFNGCASKSKFWEYKVISYAGYESRDGSGAFHFQTITPNEEDLKKLGAEGWEIATSYLEMETAFPNFGSADYHTGIKENVRPQRLVLILKREKSI